MIATVPWWVASLVANACIIFIEYTNRVSPGGWRDALPYTFLPIVVAQWLLYATFVGAPHWLTAWVVFSIGNSVLRVACVYLFLDQEVTSWAHVVFGVTVVTAGLFLMKEGLR